MPDPIEVGLPTPTPEAEAHSARVQAHLHALIASAPQSSNSSQQPSISFADFMRAALYAPGLGYYAAGATKLGASGDFVTAPELSSLFGVALADVFAPMNAESVLELGAGSGNMARDFLQHSSAATKYSILDISADLRGRQNTFQQCAL